MASKHRPDFDAFRNESQDQRPVAPTRYRDAFHWPDINLEDLLKPRILPIFLKARARYVKRPAATEF